MFKHTVTYEDFNGVERKEELLFHLSTPEITRLEAEIKMPLEQYIGKLKDDNKLDSLLAFLEKMILTSYGQKSEDGRSFLKNEKMRTEFEYSNAYAEVFEEVIQNPEFATAFGQSVGETAKSKKNQVDPKVINNPVN